MIKETGVINGIKGGTEINGIELGTEIKGYKKGISRSKMADFVFIFQFLALFLLIPAVSNVSSCTRNDIYYRPSSCSYLLGLSMSELPAIIAPSPNFSVTTPYSFGLAHRGHPVLFTSDTVGRRRRPAATHLWVRRSQPWNVSAVHEHLQYKVRIVEHPFCRT